MVSLRISSFRIPRWTGWVTPTTHEIWNSQLGVDNLGEAFQISLRYKGITIHKFNLYIFSFVSHKNTNSSEGTRSMAWFTIGSTRKRWVLDCVSNLQKRWPEPALMDRCGRFGVGNMTWNMGVSKNNGTPQIIHSNRGFHYKPSILGYPYFWKHPHEMYSSMKYHWNINSNK